MDAQQFPNGYPASQDCLTGRRAENRETRILQSDFTESVHGVMLGGDGRRYRPHAPQAHQRKDIIMMNGKKFMAAVMRGFEASGMNALAQAGYSEATTKAFEAIENR